jgi:sugar lactone lactonase YvrE
MSGTSFGVVRAAGLRRTLASCALIGAVLTFGQLPSGAADNASPTLTVLGGVSPSPSTTEWKPGLATQLGYLTAIAADRKGNTFVAATDSTISKIRPDGSTRLIAGTSNSPGSPTPGSASSSLLAQPWALAVDRLDNLYVADIDANEILKITPQGALSVVVGNGTQGIPTPGPASASQIGRPTGVAVDRQGNIYVADSSSNIIEKIASDGTLSLFAGSGTSGDPVPGLATASPFAGLGRLAIRGSNLYFIDHSAHRVGKIDLASRSLSLIAGSGARYGFPSPGPALNAGFNELSGIAVDRSGNVFIADSDNSVVVKVAPDGTLSPAAGNGGYGTARPGPATSTSLQNPVGLAFDPEGNLVIADPNSGNGSVYKVSFTTGDLSRVAGIASSLPTGSAQVASLRWASGVAVDVAGNTYGALPNENVVFKITPSGSISVVVGNGEPGSPTPGIATASSLWGPESVAVDSGGNLYIADANNRVIEKVSPTGILSIVAGTGSYGKPTPGVATSSPMAHPSGLALDGAGNLYFADAYSPLVGRISPTGELSIVAGDGNYGAPTPGPATASQIEYPGAIAVDGDGNLFIADEYAAVVEKVSASGDLSIVAGNGSSGSAIEGPATSSPLNYPRGVAVDESGNLYIADAAGGAGYCGLVEQVAPDGTLSVLGGTGQCADAVAGPAGSSPIFGPSSLTVAPSGNLVVMTAFQVVSIDLGASSFRPQITTLRSSAGGLQVRWHAPASTAGKVSTYVATARDANGQVLGSCTGSGSSRRCRITGLPSSGTVHVTVAANERNVPHSASAIVAFTSNPQLVDLAS